MRRLDARLMAVEKREAELHPAQLLPVEIVYLDGEEPTLEEHARLDALEAAGSKQVIVIHCVPGLDPATGTPRSEPDESWSRASGCGTPAPAGVRRPS